MKCKDMIAVLEELAPKRCACNWDNPGLLAGRTEKEVKKILLTVDVDDRTVETAVREGVDMIISHHPLIFKAVKHVTDEDFIGRRLVRMIQADISCFAMHTNFDAAPGCMADAVADRLGIVFGSPLADMGERGTVWCRQDWSTESTDEWKSLCQDGQRRVWTSVCKGIRQ